MGADEVIAGHPTELAAKVMDLTKGLGVDVVFEHVGVDTKKASRALCSFKNVKRRLEVKGTVNGITLYDDFAHHPTAVQLTKIETTPPSRRATAVGWVLGVALQLCR